MSYFTLQIVSLVIRIYLDMINMDEETLGVVLIGVLVVAVIGGVCIGCSYGKIDTNEAAIRRNRWTGQIDDDNVYTTGRIKKGLGYELIKFPTNAILVSFNGGPEATDGMLTARTSDGLSIDIDISFTYRLNISELMKMYQTYVLTYEEIYILTARSILRDVVSLYSAIQFFSNRSEITTAMHQSLDLELKERFAMIEDFQMTRFDLPDDFEKALEDVQIAQQQYEIAIHEQRAALVDAETQIMLATLQAEQMLIEAQASADAFLIQMTAQAQALNITITAEAEMLQYLADTLGLNSTELLAYLWIQAITEHESAFLIIGATTPQILIGDNV